MQSSSSHPLSTLRKDPELDSDTDEPKVFIDDSPYEEVRAAVSNTDDASMPCVPQSLEASDLVRKH